MQAADRELCIVGCSPGCYEGIGMPEWAFSIHCKDQGGRMGKLLIMLWASVQGGVPLLGGDWV